MKTKPRWWQSRPGRWKPQLEDALASDEPSRSALAWAIIIYSSGKEDRNFSDFAADVGMDKGTLSRNLSQGGLRRDNAARVCDLLGWDPRRFQVVAHPFAIIQHTEGIIVEPGDADWLALWELLRRVDPGTKSASDLQAKYPDVFP